jgi:hypothetical protein
MIPYAGLPGRPKSIVSTRASSAKFVHIAPITVSDQKLPATIADMSDISPKTVDFTARQTTDADTSRSSAGAT